MRYILIYEANLKLRFSPECCAKFIASEFKKRSRVYYGEFNNEPSETTIKLKNDKKIHLYDNPIELCGQTYDDMNYGNESYYGELEYEGNNYGDTSTFYFVGELA